MTGNESWLDMEIPMERMLTLEKARRAVPRLSLDQLRELHDDLLVSYVTQQHVLCLSIMRVAELEQKEYMVVGEKHKDWAQEILKDLADLPEEEDKMDSVKVETSAPTKEWAGIFWRICLLCEDQYHMILLLLYSSCILCLSQGT
jgi:hypothetical protein